VGLLYNVGHHTGKGSGELAARQVAAGGFEVVLCRSIARAGLCQRQLIGGHLRYVGTIEAHADEQIVQVEAGTFEGQSGLGELLTVLGIVKAGNGDAGLNSLPVGHVHGFDAATHRKAQLAFAQGRQFTVGHQLLHKSRRAEHHDLHRVALGHIGSFLGLCFIGVFSATREQH